MPDSGNVRKISSADFGDDNLDYFENRLKNSNKNSLNNLFDDNSLDDLNTSSNNLNDNENILTAYAQMHEINSIMFPLKQQIGNAPKAISYSVIRLHNTLLAVLVNELTNKPKEQIEKIKQTELIEQIKQLEQIKRIERIERIKNENIKDIAHCVIEFAIQFIGICSKEEAKQGEFKEIFDRVDTFVVELASSVLNQNIENCQKQLKTFSCEIAQLITKTTCSYSLKQKVTLAITQFINAIILVIKNLANDLTTVTQKSDLALTTSNELTTSTQTDDSSLNISELIFFATSNKEKNKIIEGIEESQDRIKNVFKRIDELNNQSFDPDAMFNKNILKKRKNKNERSTIGEWADKFDSYRVQLSTLHTAIMSTSEKKFEEVITEIGHLQREITKKIAEFEAEYGVAEALENSCSTKVTSPKSSSS